MEGLSSTGLPRLVFLQLQYFLFVCITYMKSQPKLECSHTTLVTETLGQFIPAGQFWQTEYFPERSALWLRTVWDRHAPPPLLVWCGGCEMR